MAAAFKEFEDNAMKQASIPEWIPDLDQDHIQFWLPSRIAEYADRICEGVSEFFLCRQLSCLKYSPSTSWIEQTDKHRFRCPSCCWEFAPWIARTDLIGCQKVMVCTTARDIVCVSGDVVPAGTTRIYLAV